jgi:hypothetical protein
MVEVLVLVTVTNEGLQQRPMKKLERNEVLQLVLSLVSSDSILSNVAVVHCC